MYHGTGLVSTIISKPDKRLYCPAFRFQYGSAKLESYLKNLALLPNIKSKQDLITYVDFYKKHGLRECYVNMNKNNPAKEYSDKMIENFRKTNSDGRVYKVMRISNHEVLKSYYNHNNIERPKLYSRDFTLDSLLEYSNIEWIAKLLLSMFPTKSQDLQKKLRDLYDEYLYQEVGEKDALRYLLFNPYYEVVNDYDHEEVLPITSVDDAQPSTSKYNTPANTSFEFKKKPKVATKSHTSKLISNEEVDLTQDNEDQIILTEVVSHENIATTNSCNSPSVPEPVLNEDSDHDEIDDEEDKLRNIANLLFLSKSFLVCVRDIYQRQKYLTATDWRINMTQYVYEFLKANISLDIVNYVNDFKYIPKEHLIELINDYLSYKQTAERTKIDTETTDLVIQPEETDLVIQPEETNVNIVSNISIATTSVESLNVDPDNLQMKQESNREIVEVSSDSEPCVVDAVPIPPTIDPLELACPVNIKREQISEADEQSTTYSEVEIHEMVDEIIEIDDSDNESNICIEFNMIDDKLKMKTSNSDIYLKSAEQGDTQQETIINSDPIASCSTNIDPRLEHSYNSITYQDHIDDQRESKKRKMAINTMNRIESAMNEPSAKRIANKENVTVRKNPNIVVVMTSKPSSRNIYMQESSSEEIQPLPQTGNIDFTSHIDDVLNREYSVFLSSQVIGYSEHDTNADTNDNNIFVPPINFTNQINPDNPVIIPNNNAACFYANIVGARFQKDEFFILTLNIPQFKFYSIDIEDNNIKTLLNLNALEWKTLTDLLNLAIKYVYVNPKKGEVKSSKTDSNMFTTLLDKFFETSTAFKSFYLNYNNNSLICYNADNVPAILNIDLSSTIPSNILKAMKRLKETGTSE